MFIKLMSSSHFRVHPILASRDEERKENACMNFISTVSDYVIKTLQSEKTLIVVRVLAVVVIGIENGKEAVEAVMEASLLLHQAVNVMFLSHGGVSKFLSHGGVNKFLSHVSMFVTMFVSLFVCMFVLRVVIMFATMFVIMFILQRVLKVMGKVGKQRYVQSRSKGGAASKPGLLPPGLRTRLVTTWRQSRSFLGSVLGVIHSGGGQLWPSKAGQVNHGTVVRVQHPRESLQVPEQGPQPVQAHSSQVIGHVHAQSAGHRLALLSEADQSPHKRHEGVQEPPILVRGCKHDTLEVSRVSQELMSDEPPPLNLYKVQVIFKPNHKPHSTPQETLDSVQPPRCTTSQTCMEIVNVLIYVLVINQLCIPARLSHLTHNKVQVPVNHTLITSRTTPTTHTQLNHATTIL